MSPLPPDPYKILGVSKDAQTAAIRSAHRKLVLKCHPDKVQDPKLKAEKQDEFQRVQQAYELLTDDTERQKYDEKVKMESLRKNMTKVHISSPRASPRFAGEFEIRTPETRSSPFKSSTPPAGTKVYTTYTRGYDNDYSRGARMFEANLRPSSKREASYADKPTKRESEREREREREKERDRDRERRRKDDDRRAAKAEKEALKADKKRREKQRDKDIKREAEAKQQQRYAKPQVDDFVDEDPVSSRADRTRSSSKKYDEKRDLERERDHDRGRASPRAPIIGRIYSNNEHAAYSRASSYMNASGMKHPGLQRSASYSVRSTHPPMAPTPPPPANKKSAYVGPDDTDSDDNVRRSAARSRRGSGDSGRMPRERAYRQSSRDVLEDSVPASASPAAQQAPKFSNSASNTPVMSGSPPRWELPRTNTMPVQANTSRPMPGISRAQTFNSFGENPPRGRGRSRLQPQVDEESDSDDYDRRTRDSKYRSSRRTHSPEPVKSSEIRYAYEGGRTRRKESYSGADSHAYAQSPYAGRVSEARFPGMYRESSYAPPPMARYPSVKTAKMYSPDDVRYSDYNSGPHRGEYAVRA